ncbi:MAG: polyribonucleotide nucleotidyltransferase [Candidatus Roizmanbacteria bacterium]
MHKVIEESFQLNGATFSLETGKLARSATVAVLAKHGDTCVLVTLTVGKERTDIDYVPLQIEYVEKLYAGGRIKGSRWVKREGRPSDDAILKGRLIDRGIRPLFPKTWRKETQIIMTLLSVDGEHSDEIVSAIATSAALHASPIPWEGPISTVRVGYVKEEGAETGAIEVNPTEGDMVYSTMELVVTSSKEKVLMLEMAGAEINESIIEDAIEQAKVENARIIDHIESFAKKVGHKKEVVSNELFPEKLVSTIKKDFNTEMNKLIDSKAKKEFGDDGSFDFFVKAVKVKLGEEFDVKIIAQTVDYLCKKAIHDRILETKVRIDGRKPDQVREITCEVGVLPRIHGTGLFQRGDTQVLSIVTLGAPDLEQMIEGPSGISREHYMHHYYMPPYSVGETGRVGVPSRREIGHGALAEKAIEPVLPVQTDFPYAIRVVSEVLSSNGSTSMASTCGSTLALLDAGVPLKAPVSGIAMGILSRSDDDYLILTDIMGIEDFSGEMDFKATGTKDGITAVQLDVKNKGLTKKMIHEVLVKAKIARLFILDKMNAVITSHRKEVSEFAPKIVVIHPPQDKIGEIIGPGGRNIRSLIAKTQTEINIDDDGNVTIAGLQKEQVEEAVRMIEGITKQLEEGEKFTGVVKRMLPFGAFVEVLPGKEGLIHVSKMGKGFVKNPADVVQIGDEVDVEVIQIDQQGRINLQLLRRPGEETQDEVQENA